MHGDRSAHARLDAVIASIEARTDAEVMLAVARASGSYRDVDHIAAALVAAFALVAMLGVHLGRLGVPDQWLVPPVVAAYVAGFVLSNRTFALRRLLTTAARRARQVKRAARATFVEERVHATKKRDGLLIYFSALERSVEILADHGIEGRLENAAWNTIARDLEKTAQHGLEEATVTQAIQRAGELLASRIPKSPDDQDEVLHRVRVRG